MNTIQTVDHANEVTLADRFRPFELQANEWMEKAKTIKVTNVTQVAEMQQAREARIALMKIRTQGIDKTHQELKADALREGQLLDKIKRTLNGMIIPIEAYLEEQENFAKVQAAKAKKELFTKRAIALENYIPLTESIKYPLGDMEEDAFQNLFEALKLAKERKRKAEDEQKEAVDKLIKLKQERFAIRVNRMKSVGFIESENSMQQNFESGIGYFCDLKTVVEASDAEFEKEISDAIARNTDNQKKKEVAAKRKAARAPDKDKLLQWAHEYGLIKVPNVKDPEAHEIAANAVLLVEKLQNYITSRANKL